MAYFQYLLLLQIAVVCVVNGANSNPGGNGNRAAQMASGNIGRSPGMAMMMREMMSGQSPNNAAGSSPNEAIPFPGPRVIAPPNIPFQCSLFADSGYFCPFGYERPSVQWYYEPYSQRCEAFYYRGCGGTPNRYSSRLECLRSCGCFSNIDYGNFCPNTFYTTRWVFNKYTGACDRIRFGGCGGGNDNNFRSHLECESTCGPSHDRPFGPIFGIGNMALGAAASARGNIAQNQAAGRANGGKQSK
nr:papilin-like [Crassostrea gigas]